MCFDEHEDDVVFPSSKKGFFYRIYDHEESGIGLVSAEDLIDKQDEFPLLVRHMIGEMPMLTTTYSSVMKCFTVIEEQTILASTLDPDSMAPLELQVDSDVKFKLSLNDAKVKYSDTYTEALQLCKSDGDDYLRGIKAAFKFRPSTPEEEQPVAKSEAHVIEKEAIEIEKETIETEKETIETERETIEMDQPTSQEAALVEVHVGTIEKEEIEKRISQEEAAVGLEVTSPNDTMSETTANISDDEPSCYGSDMEEEDAQSEFAFEWTENEMTKPSTASRDTERRVQLLKGGNKNVYVPKVFNSSINSPRGSVESRIDSWN
ncbi:hypothetical protein FSP39_002496 [Pinctada imbricata]|uniref:Uncharacterized protein n=1 Tax=Pinctada imbricata TaxID=66713 RepID=A0AA88XPJ3_PINIB|nr:hypothetical protein FSP39_002496 [Pinctada imbricata]